MARQQFPRERTSAGARKTFARGFIPLKWRFALQKTISRSKRPRNCRWKSSSDRDRIRCSNAKSTLSVLFKISFRKRVDIPRKIQDQKCRNILANSFKFIRYNNFIIIEGKKIQPIYFSLIKSKINNESIFVPSWNGTHRILDVEEDHDYPGEDLYMTKLANGLIN